MSATTLTGAEELASFAATSMRAGVPMHVLEDAVLRVTDVVGNCLAAGESTAPTEPHMAILGVVAARGGRPEATTLLAPQRLPMSSAALVNGTLAHALDFDDTHLPSVVHPSASVVPAALAVAEARGASGRDLLTAVAVGIEVTNRLGMVGYLSDQRSSVYFDRGQHATSICGTIGASVAAGMILGLDDAGILAAIGIAASMGAGVIEANRTGGTVKRIHCGWAAHSGIEAALFAEAGITGPPTVLEGGFGFFRAHLGDEYNYPALLQDLGSSWESTRTVFKPYPSNHFTHPIIDCALALRGLGVVASDIADVTIGTSTAVLRTIAQPREEKVHPRTAYHAKFSGPFTFAAAMLGGGGLGLYLDDFTPETLADPAYLALAARCTLVGDPTCDAEFPVAFSAVVRIRTHAGETMEHRVHSSRGGPEHPLTPSEVETKFRLNAARVLDNQELDRVAVQLQRLPQVKRFEPFRAEG